MFWLLRRLFWFGTGASVGFGGAMWIRNRIRRAVGRYAPEQLTTEVAHNVRRAGDRVGNDARRVGGNMREAWVEGRTAMQRREAELHQELRPSKTPGIDQ